MLLISRQTSKKTRFYSQSMHIIPLQPHSQMNGNPLIQALNHSNMVMFYVQWYFLVTLLRTFGKIKIKNFPWRFQGNWDRFPLTKNSEHSVIISVCHSHLVKWWLQMQISYSWLVSEKSDGRIDIVNIHIWQPSFHFCLIGLRTLSS